MQVYATHKEMDILRSAYRHMMCSESPPTTSTSTRTSSTPLEWGVGHDVDRVKDPFCWKEGSDAYQSRHKDEQKERDAYLDSQYLIRSSNPAAGGTKLFIRNYFIISFFHIFLLISKPTANYFCGTWTK